LEESDRRSKRTLVLRVTAGGAGRAAKVTVGTVTFLALVVFGVTFGVLTELEVTLLVLTVFGVTFGMLTKLEATLLAVALDTVRFVLAADAAGASDEAAYVEGDGKSKSIPARSDLPCWSAM
jgi:hypothetical protein